MMVSTNSANLVGVPSGPGKILQDARVRQHLSVEQVAQMLHLSAHQVGALENDEFDKLPGPTYVRGYLRNYAQALGLSAEDVVAAYARLNGTQPTISLSRLTPEPEVTTRDALVKVATFLVAGILILLAIVWWQGRHNAPVAGESRVGSDRIAKATVNPTAPPSAAEPTANAEREAQTGESFFGGVKAVDVLGAGYVANTQSTYDSATGGAAAFKQESFEPTSIAAESGPAGIELVVRAREASWTDIRDARHNKLLYGVLPAGRTVTVTGTPPFRVFVGNPDGVDLEYKGEYFAASQYKRGIVARFIVGMPVSDIAQ